MKEKSQMIYEDILKKSENLDLHQVYALAVLGMMRTVNIFREIEKEEYYKEAGIIVQFIETNRCNFIERKESIENIQPVIDFLYESEDLLEYAPEPSEDNLILQTGLQDLFDEWYYFCKMLKYPMEETDKENIISYFTFPVRYLNEYIYTIYFDKEPIDKIQEIVNNHKLLNQEIERMEDDLEAVELNNILLLNEKVNMYLKMDILQEHNC